MSEENLTAFGAAIDGAFANASNEEAWSKCDELATILDDPKAILELYLERLSDKLSEKQAVFLGKQIDRFHEEWLNDDVSSRVAALTQVFQLAPTNPWPFQKLTVVLTLAERWDDVFALYDLTIEQFESKSERVRLLEEAFQVAKDLAGQPNRAIDYLKAKLALEPDPKQEQALERLLEKHERFVDLINLWERQLTLLENEEHSTLLIRIAEVQESKLSNNSSVISTLRTLFEGCDEAARAQGIEIAKRIATDADTDDKVRQGISNLARDQYLNAGQSQDALDLLESTLPFVAAGRLPDLKKEIAQRYLDDGQNDAAHRHLSDVLAIVPTDNEAFSKLRTLFAETNQVERYRDALVRAAEVSEDTVKSVYFYNEAANALVTQGQHDDAIVVLQQSLNQETLAASDAVRVGRQLNEILTRQGRHADRLETLERIVTNEENAGAKRAYLQEIASIAEELGEHDKALAAWRRCHDCDPSDLAALNHCLRILQECERYEELVDALHQHLVADPESKEPDLIHIAEIQENRLDEADKAVLTWQRIAEETPRQAESDAQISRLLRKLEWWEQLSAHLEESSLRQITSLADDFIELGNGYSENEETLSKALNFFRRALAMDPEKKDAASGLHQLLEHDTHRAAAADALAEMYRSQNDFQGLLELAKIRLDETTDSNRRSVILREAADLAEHHVGNPSLAFEYLCELFPLRPLDAEIESRVLALGASLDQNEDAIASMEIAVDAIDDGLSKCALLHRIANMQRDEGSEARVLFETFSNIIKHNPSDLDALKECVTIAGGIKQWAAMAELLTLSLQKRHKLPEDVWEEVNAVNDRFDGFAEFTEGLDEATHELSGNVRADVLYRISHWRFHHLSDVEGAKTALGAAIALNPYQPGWIDELARLQRKSSDPKLQATVESLIELHPTNIDLLVENLGLCRAAEDEERTLRALQILLDRASAAWRSNTPTVSEAPLNSLCKDTIAQLVEAYKARSKFSAALDTLSDAARLPFNESEKLEFRTQAAAIATELGHPDAASDMLRGILRLDPKHQDAISSLATLHRDGEQWPELLSLKLHELKVSTEASNQVELRLTIDEVIARIDKNIDRIALLKANLDEEPGHQATLEAIRETLTREHRFQELVAILQSQAERIELQGPNAQSSSLWRNIGDLAHHKLENQDLALEAYMKIAESSQDAKVPASIAEIHRLRGDHDEAIHWLRKAVQISTGDERQGHVQELSRGLVHQNRTKDALGLLQSEIIEAEGDSTPLLVTLANLHRELENWSDLANLQSDALVTLTDDELRSSWSQEAALLFHTRLASPQLATSALEIALKYSSDKTLKLYYAQSLRANGALSEAREIVVDLIESFGSKRSKEKADLHVELARIEEANGAYEEARNHFETASKIDTGNPSILLALAQSSQRLEQIDKADKILRQLLMIVRRTPPGDALESVGASEVLYELHRVAAVQGDQEQSSEVLESAFEAAMESDIESRRLERVLTHYDDQDNTIRLLETIIDSSSGDEERGERMSTLAKRTEDSDPDKSFSLRMEALGLTKDALPLIPATRAQAETLGRSGQLISTLVELAEQKNATGARALAASLYFVAADMSANEIESPKDALKMYRLAREHHNDPFEVESAILTLCEEDGDSQGQLEALENLISLSGVERSTKTELTLKVAALHATSEGHGDRVIELLSGLASNTEVNTATLHGLYQEAVNQNPGHFALLSATLAAAKALDETNLIFAAHMQKALCGHSNLGELQEAATLALEHGEGDHRFQLLKLAEAEVAEKQLEASLAPWVFEGLIQEQARRGALREAADALNASEHLFESGEVLAFSKAIAQGAAAHDDDALATEILEELRETYPSCREIWEPLFALYRKSDNAGAIVELIEATLPTLVEADERNTLRIEKANTLILLERDSEAIAALRECLFDDASNLEASALLEDVLRRDGNEEELAEFLNQRFEEAKAGGDMETIADGALRLGRLLTELESPDADRVYEQALEFCPENSELLQVIIARMPDDTPLERRSEFGERLLRVIDDAVAPQLAMQLVELREASDDDEGVLRALQIAHMKSPLHTEVNERLETWYRENEMWERVVAMKIAQAEASTDNPQRAIASYVTAASVTLTQLSSPSDAAELLADALEHYPNQVELVATRARALAQNDQSEEARQILDQALAEAESEEDRLRLSIMLGTIASDAGHHEEAIASLEQAYELDPNLAAQALVQALRNRRDQAAQSSESEAEAEATHRLVEIFMFHKDLDSARSLLALWIEKNPGDLGAVEKLREIETECENWQSVLALCQRLCETREGEEQLSAANDLVDASLKLEAPDNAIAGLRAVHEDQPADATVRDFLRDLYVQSGAHRELAELLLSDADYADTDEERYNKLKEAADIFVNKLGDPNAAIQPVNRAKEIRPNDHGTVVMLTDLLIVSGQLEEAIAMLKPAIDDHKRRSPELASLQHRMSKVAALQDNQDEQLKWLKKAFDVDRKNGFVASELAHLATELGDFDLALKPLRAISLMDVPGPVSRVMALLWEAKIEHQRGNTNKAELWAKKALREDPDYEEAHEFLASLES